MNNSIILHFIISHPSIITKHQIPSLAPNTKIAKFPNRSCVKLQKDQKNPQSTSFYHGNPQRKLNICSMSTSFSANLILCKNAYLRKCRMCRNAVFCPARN